MPLRLKRLSGTLPVLIRMYVHPTVLSIDVSAPLNYHSSFNTYKATLNISEPLRITLTNQSRKRKYIHVIAPCTHQRVLFHRYLTLHTSYIPWWWSSWNDLVTGIITTHNRATHWWRHEFKCPNFHQNVPLTDWIICLLQWISAIYLKL